MKLDLATEVLDIAGSSKSIFSNKFSSYERIGMMNKVSQTIMDTSKLLEELKTLINKQNTVYLNSAWSKLRTKNNHSSWNLNRYRVSVSALPSHPSAWRYPPLPYYRQVDISNEE
jgi:hypothetical protein